MEPRTPGESIFMTATIYLLALVACVLMVIIVSQAQPRPGSFIGIITGILPDGRVRIEDVDNHFTRELKLAWIASGERQNLDYLATLPSLERRMTGVRARAIPAKDASGWIVFPDPTQIQQHRRPFDGLGDISVLDANLNLRAFMMKATPEKITTVPTCLRMISLELAAGRVPTASMACIGDPERSDFGEDDKISFQN